MLDALFIRSLLLSFYFKLFPEIVEDGRLFIAEPPLYKVANKKDPFVINREDYITRYIKDVIRNYQIGYPGSDFLDKGELREFLTITSYYSEDLALLARHYRINERLLEIIFTYLAKMEVHHKTNGENPEKLLLPWENGYDPIGNPQELMIEIQSEFPEIYYDDHGKLIKGVIDGRYQTIELSKRLCRKGWPMIDIIGKTVLGKSGIMLKELKTGNSETYSLLTALKILRRYQPDIVHRFKGLGENDDEDLRQTVMDPNSRMLIRVNIDDLNNDMQIFNMLRGNTPQDLEARRKMMRDFTLPRELIDT